MTVLARVLLDEMYSPGLVVLLADRKIDAGTVCGDEVLEGQPDDPILRAATDADRCLVTENVRDLERLRIAWAEQQREVAGLLYVSAGRYPRVPSGQARFVDAIANLASAGRIPSKGGVEWLDSGMISEPL